MVWRPSEFKRRRFTGATESLDDRSTVFPFLCAIPPCCGVSADYVAEEDDAAAATVYTDSREWL